MNLIVILIIFKVFWLSPPVHIYYRSTQTLQPSYIYMQNTQIVQSESSLQARGFIRSRQMAKIAAYFVRIYLFLPPTLSVFSLTLLMKIHQFAAYFSQHRQLFQNLLKTLQAYCSFNLKGYGGHSFTVSFPTVWNLLVFHKHFEK